MADHRVVVRKERHYPFRPFWVCVCGHIFKAEFMGVGKGGLNREFAQHEKEVKSG